MSNLHLVGHLEHALIGIVESLDRGIVDLDVLEIGVDRNRRGRDLPLLVEQGQIALDVAHRRDIAVGDRLLQRRERQFLPHPLLERQRSHVLRDEELFVFRARKLSVLLKRRQLADELRQLRVGNAQITATYLLIEHPLPDKLLEHRIADLGVAEHGWIVVLAGGLAHPILLFADRVREFGLADRLAPDAGDFGG